MKWELGQVISFARLPAHPSQKLLERKCTPFSLLLEGLQRMKERNQRFCCLCTGAFRRALSVSGCSRIGASRRISVGAARARREKQDSHLGVACNRQFMLVDGFSSPCTDSPMSRRCGDTLKARTEPSRSTTSMRAMLPGGGPLVSPSEGGRLACSAAVPG